MNWYDQKREIVVTGSLALSEAEQCDQHGYGLILATHCIFYHSCVCAHIFHLGRQGFT